MYSCSPTYYIPNSHNVPLISEKGETQILVAGNQDRIEFNAAYALTESFAIKANAAIYIPKKDVGFGSGNYFEFGGGYFSKFASNEKFVFETYGLLGVGSLENQFTDDIQSITHGFMLANAIRLGIQPNVGYRSKFFTCAVSTRFVNLRYYNVRGNLVIDSINQIDYLKTNNSYFLLEPALTIRVGFEKLKLQAQMGYSINLSEMNLRQDEAYITLGLNYNIFL